MDQHRLDRGGKGVVATPQTVEQMQTLAFPCQHLRGDGQSVTCMDFIEIADMVLDRKIAATRGDIGSGPIDYPLVA